MALWAAMGIGALMGGLSAKQRGGNFLKGALQGAALGGATGYLGGIASGTAAGTTEGGIFGFGKKMLPNFLAMSGIGMGSEMLGQGEANKQRMEQTRKWLDEEEERRIARLSRIAGYDVADSANFMTPNKYFATSAEGGMISRPQYQFGGISSLEDDPANAVNIQELQMDPGTMSPGGLTEEFDYMDEASLSPEIQKLYRAFLIANQTTEEEVPVEMFMQLMQQQGGGQGAQQGPMMAAEGGQVNRPGYAWAGPVFKDQGFDTSGGETWQQAKATQMGDKGLWTDKWFDQRTPMAQDYNQLLKDRNRYGEGYIDQSGIGLNTEEKFFNEYPNIPRTFKPFEDLEEQMNIGEFPKKAPPGYFDLAGGGSVMGKDEYDEELNRPQMFLGGALGIGALLGLSKLFGGRKKRGDVKAPIKKPILKPFPKPPGIWKPGEDDMENFPIIGLPWERPPLHALLNRAKGGGIGDLDLRGGGASNGPGTGTSDDIPAMLSDGEFVVTANAVQNLGGGDRMLGAQRMYRMMNQLDPSSQTPAEMSGVGYA